MPLRLRAQRRAFSRDAARHYAAPGLSHGPNRAALRKHGQRGDVSALVHGKHDTAWLYSGTLNASGQARINHKRQQRAEFWRTVRIRVSTPMELEFRDSLHLLGSGTRIDGRTPADWGFTVDLDVHIPGAPADAVRAEPMYRSERTDDGYVPVLDHIGWYSADGSLLTA